MAQRLLHHVRMHASKARAVLLAEHEELRTHLTACRDQARRLLAGESCLAEFRDAVAKLRDAFLEHNNTEKAWLEPLLLRSESVGQRRIDRMIAEHAAEHVAMREAMSGNDLEVAARMTDLADDIDAHMAAEERTFLSPAVLSDRDHA